MDNTTAEQALEKLLRANASVNYMSIKHFIENWLGGEDKVREMIAALSAPRVSDGFVRASDYIESIGKMEMIRGASLHCDCRAFEIATAYLNETHGGRIPLTPPLGS